jgi:hypothetical protein
MAQLSWVTPQGSIANLLIGLTSAVHVQVVDTANNGADITYQIISGELPPGMTLDTINIAPTGSTVPQLVGQLSGTPTYSTPSNNYFTTLNYDFTIRATSANGYSAQDRTFTIIVTNTVNIDFTWITPSGDLGTVPNGEYYQLPLLVSETHSGITTTFSFVSGELPPGMEVNKLGFLQGVPTLLNSIAVDTSESFRFTIRATNSLGHVRDQAFSLTVTNVYGPVIEPSTSFLGSHFDGTYFSQQLTVNELNPNVSVVWSNIGNLPPGLSLSSTGSINGYLEPVQLVGLYGPAGFDGSAIVSTIYAGYLIPGVVYQIQLTGTTDFTLIGAPNNHPGTVFRATGAGTGSGVVSEYNTTVQAGFLVPGINYQIKSVGTTDFTLIGASANIVGTIFTATGAGSASTTGVVSQYITPGVEFQEYDLGPYDFNELTVSASYSFTIRAYDGANYDLQDYILNVVSRTGFTADSGSITTDNQGLTIDTTDVYIPILLNGNVSILPEARASAYYAYKFEGQDFQNDTLTYSLTNTTGTFDAQVIGTDNGFDYGGTGTNGSSVEDPNPVDLNRGGIGFDSYINVGGTNNLPGLLLDSATGWLYGQLNSQVNAYQEYEFGVQVSKTRNGVTYTSQPQYFTLPVLGDINNILQWVTPSDLGTITNGAVSEIFLEAKSIANKPLVYSLVDQAGVSIRLPQGLELITDTSHNIGLISGRVSFETFSIDGFNTIFDGAELTIDRTYTFSVKVETTDGSVSSIRKFTLKLNVVDHEPYDNLYLRAMPAFDQRQIFNSIVSNAEIFVPELIYRPQDPWFGVANDIEMLFLWGLTPSDLSTYAVAMAHNHYTKNYNFGTIKTAVALNENYDIKYEVVYIEVLDPELNSTGIGPGIELDLTNTISNPYIDSNGITHTIVYPNTSQDMVSRLTTGVGQVDQSSLPEWMTSNQPSTVAGKFKVPLGFTRAVVLAYTVPGASKLIAYRLQNSGINFNNIDFTVDRYLLDDFYTQNFNVSTGEYMLGRETTFDALPTQNIGKLVATVNYAVTVPFSQINGRPVSYINANGGIDGSSKYQSGDTIVFAQQEEFLNPGPYQGWVNYNNAFIGDNILTPAIEGYDAGSYDTYNVIPGYLEKVQGTAQVNQRGGVWRINIINNIVTLVPVQEILPNQRISVLFGNTYAGAILYYNQILQPGQTVPFYSVYKYQFQLSGKRTTFNGDSTKFFSNRDSYYTPGSKDKYVKFPQYGVFN